MRAHAQCGLLLHVRRTKQEEIAMLTIQDCIELSELTEEEILAIAEHEHIPEMAALEMGSYLVHTPEGEQRIHTMIVDDIARARAEGDLVRVLSLKMCLKHYLEKHANLR
jgi:S-ribosylhomocysteine lyase LuxS involved in autoinducer biosynthesis